MRLAKAAYWSKRLLLVIMTSLKVLFTVHSSEKAKDYKDAEPYIGKRNRIPYKYYLRKSFIWSTGYFCFGLALPLILAVINMMSAYKFGTQEIQSLILGGAIVFNCFAMMGSVLFDFALGGYAIRGISIFAIFIFPFLILGLILIDCLLIHFGVIDSTCFCVSSKTTIFVVIVSFIYTIFGKAALYINEDSRHDN